MAGHFALWRLARDVQATYVPAIAGWTGVAHAAGVANGAGGVFMGWTQATRDELNRVRSAVAIPNRNMLPPHRYLTFPPGAPGAVLLAQLTLDKYGWIADLERPFNPGFGLVALCPAALAAWNGGQSGYKYDALLAQIAHGATSIEVYYLGGKEIS